MALSEQDRKKMLRFVNNFVETNYSSFASRQPKPPAQEGEETDWRADAAAAKEAAQKKAEQGKRIREGRAQRIKDEKNTHAPEDAKPNPNDARMLIDGKNNSYVRNSTKGFESGRTNSPRLKDVAKQMEASGYARSTIKSKLFGMVEDKKAGYVGIEGFDPGNKAQTNAIVENVLARSGMAKEEEDEGDSANRGRKPQMQGSAGGGPKAPSGAGGAKPPGSAGGTKTPGGGSRPAGSASPENDFVKMLGVDDGTGLGNNISDIEDIPEASDKSIRAALKQYQSTKDPAAREAIIKSAKATLEKDLKDSLEGESGGTAPAAPSGGGTETQPESGQERTPLPEGVESEKDFVDLFNDYVKDSANRLKGKSNKEILTDALNNAAGEFDLTTQGVADLLSRGNRDTYERYARILGSDAMGAKKPSPTPAEQPSAPAEEASHPLLRGYDLSGLSESERNNLDMMTGIYDNMTARGNNPNVSELNRVKQIIKNLASGSSSAPAPAKAPTKEEQPTEAPTKEEQPTEAPTKEEQPTEEAKPPASKAPTSETAKPAATSSSKLTPEEALAKQRASREIDKTLGRKPQESTVKAPSDEDVLSARRGMQGAFNRTQDKTPAKQKEEKANEILKQIREENKQGSVEKPKSKADQGKEILEGMQKEAKDENKQFKKDQELDDKALDDLLTSVRGTGSDNQIREANKRIRKELTDRGQLRPVRGPGGTLEREQTRPVEESLGKRGAKKPKNPNKGKYQKGGASRGKGFSEAPYGWHYNSSGFDYSEETQPMTLNSQDIFLPEGWVTR
jgi:hypothetical protein